jgi:hypothetical protein
VDFKNKKLKNKSISKQTISNEILVHSYYQQTFELMGKTRINFIDIIIVIMRLKREATTKRQE